MTCSTNYISFTEKRHAIPLGTINWINWDRDKLQCILVNCAAPTGNIFLDKLEMVEVMK